MEMENVKGKKSTQAKNCIFHSSRKHLPFSIDEMAEKCCIPVEDKQRSECLRLQVCRQNSVLF